MSEMNALVNDAFAKPWLIGGETIPARYRYRRDVHELKTLTSVLAKGTECISPNGERFEVVNSKRLNTSTYLHVLQPFNDKPATNWTPQR